MIINDLGTKVEKWSGIASGTTYVTVDKLAYDSTNKKLGLKVNGADTVIPFSGATVHTETYKTYGVGTKDMGASHSYRYVAVNPDNIFFSWGSYRVPIVGAAIARGDYTSNGIAMVMSTESVGGGVLVGRFTTPNVDNWYGGVAITSMPIDVTQFSKIGLYFAVSSVSTYTTVRIGLTNDVTTETNPSSIIAQNTIHPTANTNTSLECDISNISGSYYPFISYNTNQAGQRNYTMSIIAFNVSN